MENQTNTSVGGAEHTSPDTLTERQNVPDTPEVGGEALPGEQSQGEAPGKEHRDDIPPVDTPATEEKDKPVGLEKSTAPPAPEEKTPESEKSARRGRPPKEADAPKKPKAEKAPKAPKREKSAAAVGGGASGRSAGKEDAAPVVPEIPPPQPREAPRPNGQDQIVYLNISELLSRPRTGWNSPGSRLSGAGRGL